MINFELVKSENININVSELDSIFSQFKERVGSIDFSSVELNKINAYMMVNVENEQLSDLLQLGDNKYLIFQNEPQRPIANSAFESKKSTVIVRLKNIVCKCHSIKNIVFVLDFLEGVVEKKEKNENITDKVLFSSKVNSIIKKKISIDNNPEKTQPFVAVVPKFKLKNVIMTGDMRETIEDSLSILRNRKKIYEEWGFEEIDKQPKAILSFFGPSGTGKSMCAHAIADEMKIKILAVDYAEIESKWAGESPKNLISAFRTAEEENAILFFDEADSFLGKRITNVSSGHDQSINSLRSQMLILLENFEGIVIFATNLVKNYDKAFETRILSHIKFELPDENARALIFEKNIPNKIPLEKAFTIDDFKILADNSKEFSGRDIKNVILKTLALAAKENVEYLKLEHFITSIEKQKIAYKKLKAETDEAIIKKQLLDSIAESSKKNLALAYLELAIHAVWSDDVIQPKEISLLQETANVLNIELPDINDKTKLRPLQEIIEYFTIDEYKLQALDIACRMIAIDSKITDDEISFIKELYSLLGYDLDKFDDLVSYLHDLAKNNVKWEIIVNQKNNIES